MSPSGRRRPQPDVLRQEQDRPRDGLASALSPKGEYRSAKHEGPLANTFEPAVLVLADALRARGLFVATAESCTGGLIAGACTSVAGSSDWFDRGFVSYSNAAKTELLGVPAALIAADGAVSEGVARAMADGAIVRSNAALAVAVTGIAGPGGATPGKPVGLVWFALARRGATTTTLRRVFKGDRSAVRTQAVAQALQLLCDAAT